MPRVVITVRRDFIKKVSDQARMCRGIRKVVQDVFRVKLRDVSIKDLEYYAPGCDAHRPPITVEVSINRGDKMPRHYALADEIATGLRLIVNLAAGSSGNVGKLILDLVERKTVMF